MAEGHVKALPSFFTVPKGDNNVQVVYNGTKSGLNDCLWAPCLRLPMVEQHLGAVQPGTHLGDVEIGEQFHDFLMHPSLQLFAGIDLTLYFPDLFLTSTTGKCTHRALWLMGQMWNGLQDFSK